MPSIQVHIKQGVVATFESWSAGAPSDTLLLWSHGMQGDRYFEPIGPGHVPIPPRNYAFTIPFNRALFNPAFTQPASRERLRQFTERFLATANQFSSRAPLLHIYPFLVADPHIVATLAELAVHGLCDILHLTDLTGDQLQVVCRDRQTIRSQIECTREAIFRGFDTTGEARRNCKPDAPISELLGCVVIGSLVYDLVTKVELKEPRTRVRAA